LILNPLASPYPVSDKTPWRGFIFLASPMVQSVYLAFAQIKSLPNSPAGLMQIRTCSDQRIYRFPDKLTIY